MRSTALLLAAMLVPLTAAAEPAVLIDDDFDRAETDDAKEQVGGGWGTNSKGRAAGNKQVDLVDGTLVITRHPVADHGVSVTHDMAFRDGRISLRFQLPTKADNLGINIADLKEKSVHAGHICMARVTTRQVEFHDLKTGNMRLDLRNRRKAGEELTDDEKAMLKTKKKIVKRPIAPGEWHDLVVTIRGETMTIAVDGEEVGTFTSEGIGHETKRKLRLAVAKRAVVDDVKVERLSPRDE